MACLKPTNQPNKDKYIQMDVLISKTLVFWIIFISSKLGVKKFTFKSSPCILRSLIYTFIDSSNIIHCIKGTQQSVKTCPWAASNLWDQWVVLKGTGELHPNFSKLITAHQNKWAPTFRSQEIKRFILESFLEKLKEIWKQKLMYRESFVYLLN